MLQSGPGRMEWLLPWVPALLGSIAQRSGWPGVGPWCEPQASSFQAPTPSESFQPRASLHPLIESLVRADSGAPANARYEEDEMRSKLLVKKSFAVLAIAS